MVLVTHVNLENMLNFYLMCQKILFPTCLILFTRMYGYHLLLALVVFVTMLYFLTTTLIILGSTHSNKNPMCLLNFFYSQNISKNNLVKA